MELDRVTQASCSLRAQSVLRSASCDNAPLHQHIRIVHDPMTSLQRRLMHSSQLAAYFVQRCNNEVLPLSLRMASKSSRRFFWQAKAHFRGFQLRVPIPCRIRRNGLLDLLAPDSNLRAGPRLCCLPPVGRLSILVFPACLFFFFFSVPLTSCISPPCAPLGSNPSVIITEPH